jgi:hypothetical protein
MSFIYHIVPKHLKGHHLIPLNQLKELFPDEYLREARKYLGRERLMERSIPKIDCLWNDVIHFSALNPDVIYSKFEQLGFGDFKGVSWFKVPVTQIKNLPAVVYRAPPQPRPDFKLEESDVELFDVCTWREQEKLTAEADSYFQKCQKEGQRPLPFQFTAHILVRGQLNIDRVEIGSR